MPAPVGGQGYKQDQRNNHERSRQGRIGGTFYRSKELSRHTTTSLPTILSAANDSLMTVV